MTTDCPFPPLWHWLYLLRGPICAPLPEEGSKYESLETGLAALGGGQGSGRHTEGVREHIEAADVD